MCIGILQKWKIIEEIIMSVDCTRLSSIGPVG